MRLMNPKTDWWIARRLRFVGLAMTAFGMAAWVGFFAVRPHAEALAMPALMYLAAALVVFRRERQELTAHLINQMTKEPSHGHPETHP